MVPSSNLFFSHPGILLRDHLKGVAELAESFAFDATADKSFASLAKIVGLTHDLGKYTSFFQRKIMEIMHGEKGELKGGKDPRASHAPVSALASAWLVKRRFSDTFFPVMAYLVVRYHHGSLPSLSRAADDLERDLRSEIIREQISDMKRKEVMEELNDLGIGDLSEFFKVKLHSLRDIRRKMKLHVLKIEKEGWKHFYRTLILFSSLIDADKKDAGQINHLERIEIPANVVERYKARVFKPSSTSDISKIRELLFQRVSSFEPRGNILTIKAPTGSGKTLAGFHLSLKMRDGRRIVYSLPFVNIIEQNYSVLKSVLEGTLGRTGPDIILKYHHLYFPSAKDRSVDEQLMLAESFDSEAIVTTFVQLISSLATNSNSMLKKLHNLANSVIILDEVQSIPAEYWRFIRAALEEFTSLTRAKALMMTATMPLLLGKGLPGISFNASLDRYSIEFTNVNDIEGLKSLFSDMWSKTNSILIVLNTIKSSIEVYREIKDLVGDEARIFYLSANIVPKQRARRIENIKRYLRDNKKVILVSTQVVEAGVDLDFDAAIRDIAPLDSIVQVAGRCNRHGEKKRGRVAVIYLDGGSHARKIYGKVLIGVVEEVLKARGRINERELSKLMEEYYSMVEKRLNLEDESNELIERAKSLDFDAFSRFSIIEDQAKFPVFIELDDEATKSLEAFRKIYKSFRNVRELRDIFKLRAQLRKARIALENYMVSVREPPLEEDEYKMRVVHKEEIEAYYDMETGFKLERGGSEFW